MKGELSKPAVMLGWCQEDTKPEEKSGRIYILGLDPATPTAATWCTIQRLQRACKGAVSQEVLSGSPLRRRGLSLLVPRGTMEHCGHQALRS